MKLFLKIFGISISILLLLVLTVAGILLYMVFTPERLTPIVDGMAGKYITCDHKIGKVELTLFSTFPEVGLRIDDVTLINVNSDAPTDTVAHIGSAIGIVNIQRYLDSKDLEINKLLLDNVDATLFTDSAGNSNFMVFRSDTTETDSASAWPFGTINLHELKLGNADIRYIDENQGIDACLRGTGLDIEGSMSGDSIITGNLVLDCSSTSARYHHRNYLRSQPVSVNMPSFRVNLDSLGINMSGAIVNLGDMSLDIDGTAALPNDTITLNIDAATTDAWAIDSLLALVNRNLPELNLNYDIHGDATVSAHVSGQYYTHHYPNITANVKLDNGSGSYGDIPYKLEDVSADADIILNLADSTKSCVSLNSLAARTRQSAIKAKGRIDQLFGDMLLNFDVNADLNLPDLKDFLPNNIALNGRAQGPLTINTRLSNITNKQFDKIAASTQLSVTDLKVKYDDYSVVAGKADMGARLPSGNKKAQFAHITIKSDNIDITQRGNLHAIARSADLAADVNNLTRSDISHLIGDLAYDFGHLTADVSGVHADLESPRGKAAIDYDMKNKTAIPVVDATLKGEKAEIVMDTISVSLKSPDIKLALAGQKQRRDQVAATVNYKGGHIKAALGEQIKGELATLAFNGSVKQNDKQFDFLNIWNPDLKIKLGDAYADFALLPFRLEIPGIDFDFTPDDIIIRDSRVRLGNSDFSLEGNVTNLNRWLSGEANLGGDLNFTSNYTDVNQLMDLTSGFGEKDSTATEQMNDDGDPFMVPKGVDLVLHTRIRKAAIGRQIANDLGGNLYINDGTLVLEEMGFICQAAKLQLTALYRTPRRNHIYAGVDLHMLDIHIHELIDMIPDAQEMLPMLSSFSGKAEFHLALETFMNAKYELKTSTSIGAASLQGKDLVLLDSETFTKIAKLLLFRKKTENIVDSISAEITLWNRQVDIYPFMMSIDKYAAAVGGQHNLDGTYDYHISLVKPLPIGVNVKTGDDKKLHIKPTMPKYKSNFEPVKRNGVEAQNLKLREQIRAALKKNVKQ